MLRLIEALEDWTTSSTSTPTTTSPTRSSRPSRLLSLADAGAAAGARVLGDRSRPRRHGLALVEAGPGPARSWSTPASSPPPPTRRWTSVSIRSSTRSPDVLGQARADPGGAGRPLHGVQVSSHRAPDGSRPRRDLPGRPPARAWPSWRWRPPRSSARDRGQRSAVQGPDPAPTCSGSCGCRRRRARPTWPTRWRLALTGLVRAGGSRLGVIATLSGRLRRQARGPRRRRSAAASAARCSCRRSRCAPRGRHRRGAVTGPASCRWSSTTTRRVTSRARCSSASRRSSTRSSSRS